jgi:hypothetical protein
MKMLSYHLKIDRCYIDERANSPFPERSSLQMGKTITKRNICIHMR